MDTSKSSVRTSLKPVNVFYVWYTELCRRINCTPAPVVKPAKPKCQTILEFIGDRLKVEEWNPIINALRHDTSLHVINIKSRISNCQFLHEVDTEDKAKHMKRRFGSLWTSYILRQLLKSLSTSIRNTQVLTCLELDGLPMFGDYLEPLLQALKKNKTIKYLSFANCTINDNGCQLVCTYLRFTPNVEVVNLSGCGLSAESGSHLSKLIKYQQINRYCESWHNSLRYEDPLSGAMRGIKRITLNCNPNFGDEGFNYILDELEDDLWIKAVDLQRCGITESIASKILDVIQYNRSLEIVDLRQNEMLNMPTVESVLQILRDKQQFGFQPEYQWCNTAVTLTWNSVRDSTSKFSVGASSGIHKSKSAPMKNVCNGSNFVSGPLIRKSKTVENFQRKSGKIIVSKNNIDIEKVLELNTKLKHEIQKRKEIEKRNEMLECRLQEIQSVHKFETEKAPKSNLQIIKSLAKISRHGIVNTGSVQQLSYKDHDDNNLKSLVGSSDKNGYQKTKQLELHSTANGHKNGITSNGVSNGYKNGISCKMISGACKILEHLLNGKYVEDDTENENLKSYYLEDPQPGPTDEREEVGESSGVSRSQVSLIKYMEELKNDNANTTSSVRFNTLCNSKYSIKENEKR